jgi:hypothetical protein
LIKLIAFHVVLGGLRAVESKMSGFDSYFTHQYQAGDSQDPVEYYASTTQVGSNSIIAGHTRDEIPHSQRDGSMLFTYPLVAQDAQSRTTSSMMVGCDVGSYQLEAPPTQDEVMGGSNMLFTLADYLPIQPLHIMQGSNGQLTTMEMGYDPSSFVSSAHLDTSFGYRATATDSSSGMDLPMGFDTGAPPQTIAGYSPSENLLSFAPPVAFLQRLVQGPNTSQTVALESENLLRGSSSSGTPMSEPNIQPFVKVIEASSKCFLPFLTQVQHAEFSHPLSYLTPIPSTVSETPSSLRAAYIAAGMILCRIFMEDCANGYFKRPLLLLLNQNWGLQRQHHITGTCLQAVGWTFPVFW